MIIRWKHTIRTRSSGKHEDRLILTPWVLEPAVQDDFMLYHLDRRMCLEFNKKEAQRKGMSRIFLHELIMVLVDGVSIVCPFRPPFTRAQKQILSCVMDRTGFSTVIAGDGSRHEPKHSDEPVDLERLAGIVSLILAEEEMIEPPANTKAGCVWASIDAIRSRDSIAASRMDLSLLPYMDYTTRRRLIGKGIRDIRNRREVASAIMSGAHPSGMAAYTIPWLNESEDDKIVVVHRDVLDGVFEDGVRVYMDIELLERIYMCGLFIVRPGGNDEYVSFVSSCYDDPMAERELLDAVCGEIDRLRSEWGKIQMIYYFAEKRFWREACARTDHPSGDLLNSAIDLCRVIGACGALFPGAPNMKLKTIGKALYERNMIALEFPGGVLDGGDSMTIARKLFYGRLHPLDPTRTVMRITGTSHHINELRLLLEYNHYDCAILHEIIECLLKETDRDDVIA